MFQHFKGLLQGVCLIHFRNKWNKLELSAKMCHIHVHSLKKTVEDLKNVELMEILNNVVTINMLVNLSVFI